MSPAGLIAILCIGSLTSGAVAGEAGDPKVEEDGADYEEDGDDEAEEASSSKPSRTLLAPRTNTATGGQETIFKDRSKSDPRFDITEGNNANKPREYDANDPAVQVLPAGTQIYVTPSQYIVDGKELKPGSPPLFARYAMNLRATTSIPIYWGSTVTAIPSGPGWYEMISVIPYNPRRGEHQHLFLPMHYHAKQVLFEFGEQTCWDTLSQQRAELEKALGPPDEPILEWARRHGAVIPSELQVYEGVYGKGIRLGPKDDKSVRLEEPAAGLPPERLLEGTNLYVPAALLMFVKPVDTNCEGLPGDEVDLYKVQGALMLLGEKRKGAASLFAPYINSLPSLTAFANHPQNASDDELRNWYGLPAATRAGQVKKFLKDMHAALLSRPACLPESEVVDSFEEFVWAFIILQTRAWATLTLCGRQMMGLMPVHDLINHAQEGHAGHSTIVATSGTWSVATTQKGLNVGTELFHSYGPYSNENWAVRFGFIPAENNIQLAQLSGSECKQLLQTECIVPGCLFASLRDEMCASKIAEKVAPWRKELVAIYSEHALDKVAEVDQILAKFTGREDELLAKARQKYGKKKMDDRRRAAEEPDAEQVKQIMEQMERDKQGASIPLGPRKKGKGRMKNEL